MWLVPAAGSATPAEAGSFARLTSALEHYEAGRHSEALEALAWPGFAKTALAGHALYYKGLTQLALSRPAEARTTFKNLRTRDPLGYLMEAATMKEAEAAETMADHAAAVELYRGLARERPIAPDQVHYRLGKAQLAAGDREGAIATLREVYFRFPLSEVAASATADLELLRQVPAPGDSKALYELHLGRAERLYSARRYADARAAFEMVRTEASGDERDLVNVRLGQIDFHVRRYASARGRLEPYLNRGDRQAEARYFHALTLRDLGRRTDFVSHIRELVDRHPDSSWAQEGLNGLATYYILRNEDEPAAATFRELLERFPNGARASRAAWKAGWWAYRTGQYNDAARIFELAAANLPRSDNRPAFLYWAGRAHEKLDQRDRAAARFRLTRADYQNSYYGRRAIQRLGGEPGGSPRVAALAITRTSVSAAGFGAPAAVAAGDSRAAPLPTQELIRALLLAGLYADALKELEYAERAWGESAAIQATMAWAYNRTGEMRRGINLMKRAYPQYLAEGGETLPAEILKVVFPLDYWDIIRKHSTARDLDPHLVAALVAQESTFLADVRSSANAYGLMQIIPPTGRRLARSLGVSFSTAMLKRPEPNVRLGTEYFSRLMRRFGAVHLALASYNAGENRVVRWIAERSGLDEDEFIDDIPFPETQNYVKRILGTVDDYRTLYGGAASVARTSVQPEPAGR